MNDWFSAPILTDTEREQMRNRKRWAAHNQREKVATIFLAIVAAVGTALILWQVVQPQPTYWLVYLGMALVVPLLARVGSKVLKYM